MRGHVIKPTTAQRMPRSHIVLDCESTREPARTAGVELQRYRIGCAIAWDSSKSYLDLPPSVTASTYGELWDWIAAHCDRRGTTWVWAHNAVYDLTISRFWSLWDAGRFVPAWYCLDDRACIIKGRLDGRRIVLVDSHNWLRASLDDIASWVGMERTVVEDDVPGMGSLAAHCAVDCHILLTAVRRLLAVVGSEGMGSLRYSGPGQSWRHWTQLGAGGGKVTPPQSAPESKLARDAYYSGRVSCFRLGITPGPIYVVDCVGMYCSVMAASKLPCDLIDYTDRGRLTQLRDRDVIGAIADVLVTTEYDIYPRREETAGTYYPVGTYWTTLAGDELRLALRAGCILDVRRIATYRMEYVCRDFACYWWEARQRARLIGDKLLEHIAKSMPCYLYGRWGHARSGWTSAGPAGHGERFAAGPHFDGPEKVWRPGRTIAGEAQVDRARVYRRKKIGDSSTLVCQRNWSYETETECSFPAVAAFVTANARVAMERYRTVAGAANVYYQCHDCLHVGQAGYDRLMANGDIAPSVLGALKLHHVIQRADYIGCNLLVADGTLTAAGLSRDRHSIGDGRIQQRTFERWRGILSRPLDGSVKVITTTWTPMRDLAYGVPMPGGRIGPIRLDELPHAQ